MNTFGTEKSKPLKIEKFINDYYFLSNFYIATIVYEGLFFKSVEIAYQASKTLDKSIRKDFSHIQKSYDAKKLGQEIQKRIDWDLVKNQIMFSLLEEKFRNPFLKDALLQTGDALLNNNNSYNDIHWGICRGTGENLLGIYLMKIRNQIKTSQGTL